MKLRFNYDLLISIANFSSLFYFVVSFLCNYIDLYLNIFITGSHSIIF
ncbi:hypothetical protein VIBNISOn1_1450001 [Vibrio nigripulchritudo SOn1]|uniref:Uncharacterized protein n=1 Tax=Vibrio nigripulchritudo SOn1 TaxID=1238450 RepID=A0AAV2VKX5_9VIBR|nr:hypothetical protein VIBNISOn1_1450001 [Vibrio nigripulchritudo SOn1]